MTPARRVLFAALLLTAFTTLPVVVLATTHTIGSLHAFVAGERTGPVDLVVYQAAARALLEEPASLYEPVGREELLQAHRFWTPPWSALPFVPLILLPHQASYAAWVALSLLALIASIRLLAPPDHRAAYLMVGVPAALLFLPSQLALVLGQTSFLMLLGFAVFARALLAGCGGFMPGVALLVWTLKPHFLVPYLIALGLARKGRSLVLLVLMPVSAGLALVWATSGAIFHGYMTSGRELSALLLTREHHPGQTFLGLGQSLLGPGGWPLALAAGGAVLVYASVAILWRTGLQPRPDRYLQLAVLPLAATIAAPHARGYELVLWLGGACLLARFAHEVPAARTTAAWVLLLGWWTGLAVVLADWNGFEVGAMVGATLVVAVCLYACKLDSPAGSRNGGAVSTRAQPVLVPPSR